MKKIIVTSNMLNEQDQLENHLFGGWCENMKQFADGILVVDGKSSDKTQEILRSHGVTVVEDEIIQREGYGPARNHLRAEARKYFFDGHWMIYLDADERIIPEDLHKLRWYADYLIDDYDVIALPRVDWIDDDMKKMAKDWRVYPDWQARMTRLGSRCKYVRRLHEQITNFKKVFTSLNSPKINHFHRTAGQEKRDFIGKVCAKLHAEDTEYGNTYPKHHKEDHYYNLYKKEGL